VTNQLQQQLDNDLISIWYYYKRNSAEPHDFCVAEIVSKIHEYRTNNPGWRSIVSRVEWEGTKLDGNLVLAEVLSWTNAPAAK
jgi:hypothetical protein